MCGLPLFSPKPAHADRPVVGGEPLLDALGPRDRIGDTRAAGRAEAPLAVGSAVTALSASSPYAPAERAGLILGAEG